MTSSIYLTMAGWTSDKFRLSCLDNQGLKRALLKMLILDSSSSNGRNGGKRGMASPRGYQRSTRNPARHNGNSRVPAITTTYRGKPICTKASN
ncbi:hypothetical protein pipiens_019568 [Culex pipiens pipiens]|uniref:Uncharacterized protein n=1 Tax=Culex pipiens pipiens TaxID=38569 RepID=A0ABD1DUZ5_CULPP